MPPYLEWAALGSGASLTGMSVHRQVCAFQRIEAGKLCVPLSPERSRSICENQRENLKILKPFLKTSFPL